MRLLNAINMLYQVVIEEIHENIDKLINELKDNIFKVWRETKENIRDNIFRGHTRSIHQMLKMQ